MELTLEKLKDGEKGVVERLTLTGPTKRRLIEMGNTPGTEVRVLKRAPLGDPIEVYLRRYNALSQSPRKEGGGMSITIALAGNPNSGKTTLFNALTGSNQYVGNWPGVTVERKEARFDLKGEEATLVDLPGVYSLSPYSIEENITRHFIAQHAPDVVLNIVDATNIERNLYLTLQLMELERPVVIALNLMDELERRGHQAGLRGPFAPPRRAGGAHFRQEGAGLRGAVRGHLPAGQASRRGLRRAPLR